MNPGHPPQGDPPGLRLENLRAWLVDHVEPFDGSTPLSASLLAGGRSNITYVISDAQGSQCVLRRPPLGHVMPSAHDMVREYRVLSALNRIGFPTPHVRALCEDVTVIGASFMVMDLVDGRVFDTAERTQTLSKSEAGDVSGELVARLVELHQIDVSQAGLGDFGRPHDYLKRQVARWSQQWELTKTGNLRALDELKERLGREISLIRGDLPSSLVHGDYRLDNTIFDANGARIVGVLDWEMSTLGDPIADLGLSLLYWSEPSDVLRSRFPVAAGVTSPAGFWSRQEVAEDYANRSGRSLDHLKPCVALACFKMAVIMESIHHRTLTGNQIGVAASTTDGLAGVAQNLAEIGLDVLRNGVFEGLRN